MLLCALIVPGVVLGGCGGGGKEHDAGEDDGDVDGIEEPDVDAPGDADAEADAEDVTDGEEEEVEVCGFSVPEPITELNTIAADFSPDISADGLTIYFSSDRTGGEGQRDIWYATRSAIDLEFGDALDIAELSTEADERGPSISPDGLTIYFTSDMTGTVGGGDIWVATRSAVTAPFGAPVNVAELNTTSTDGAPSISADGLTMYFASDRPGSVGGLDIYVATRSAVTAPFGAPANVAELNTTVDDSAPVLTADGLTIYFSSRRPGGVGDMDLWVATRTDTESVFGEPRNVEELNTVFGDDSPGLSPDGTGIYFSSGRPGGAGDADLYFSYWTCQG